MRKILVFAGLLLGLISSAQVTIQNTGSKIRYVNGIYVGTKSDAHFGAADSGAIYAKEDSTLVFKYKGTARALAFASQLSGYKPIGDTLFNTGFTTRAQTKRVIDSLANAKQPQLNGTGFVKASGTTITYDNSTYLTGNQTITLSGDISGSGTTAITTTIGASKVTNAMLAGSIDYAKMNAATVPTWNQNTSGNAATATLAANSTQFAGIGYGGGYSSGAIAYSMVYNNTNARWEAASSSNIQSWLGLGSNAYTSTAYLPLTAGSGNTLSGDIFFGASRAVVFNTAASQIYESGGSIFLRSNSADKLIVHSTGVTLGAIAGTGSVALYAGAITGTSANFSSDITAYSVGLNGSTGGWARHYSFIGSTGTNRGGFGAFGSDNTLSYYYIGNAYNDNKFQLDASTGAATFSSTLTATGINATGGMTLTGGTMPVTAGNTIYYAYSSANHDFAFGDGTGYSYRLVKRVGSVTTSLFRLTDEGNAVLAGNLTTGGIVDATGSVYSRAVEYFRSAASGTGDAQYQSWYNSAGTRRGYFGFGNYNDNGLSLVNEATNGNININTSGSGVINLSAISGTTGAFGGLVTFNSGTIVPNGQYYRANRTTGGASINILGIESGTDNTVMVASNFFKLRNTGTGDAANLFTVSTSGDGVFTGSISGTVGTFSGSVTGTYFASTNTNGEFLRMGATGNGDLWLQGGGTFRIVNQAYTQQLFTVNNSGDLYAYKTGTFGSTISTTANSGGLSLAQFGRASDNISFQAWYSNNGSTRYGYIQASPTNGGQLVMYADGVATITLDNAGARSAGSFTASSFIKSGGTSSQYLMADGSVSTGGATGSTYSSSTYNLVNCSSATVSGLKYMQTGSIVHVSGKAVIVSTSSSAQFEIDLPVASNLAQNYDVSGVINSSSTNSAGGFVSAEITNERAIFSFGSASSGTYTAYFEFTYIVQ